MQTKESRRKAMKKALKRLATGRTYRRAELFQKGYSKNKPFNAFVGRVFTKLVTDGLIDMPAHATYKAADPEGLKEILRDDDRFTNLLWPGSRRLFEPVEVEAEALVDTVDQRDENGEPIPIPTPPEEPASQAAASLLEDLDVAFRIAINSVKAPELQELMRLTQQRVTDALGVEPASDVQEATLKLVYAMTEHTVDQRERLERIEAQVNRLVEELSS